MSETAAREAIMPGAFYPLQEFKRIMNFRETAMRTARRQGLRVRYIGGRGFVHADDFFAYLRKLDADDNGQSE